MRAALYNGQKNIEMTELICAHSDFRLNKAKELGFEICNNGKVDIRAKSQQVFGRAMSALGEICDVDIYIDAAGADGIIEEYQSMGKVNSRMVVRRPPKWMRH